ncbi:MAG TPA: glycosyltransferase family 39 protein [Candidatus Acidoferrales bacterium]|nr:glycosyltransferase family 39 protein [Candidatus Acidoferrales bacterium]
MKPPTSLRPLTWVLLITLVCLLPFINKPFHIDDPLFLRAAAQIQQHPADFYGFTMNWLGTPLPMVKDFDNPPLACYYLALAAAAIGWSEPALHLAFLLPALASAWGIFALARRFSRHPLLAAVAAVLTPVFLISATNLMCDVMCLAFWVWAVVTFERGLERNDWKWLLAAGGLAGLATLTKFTGLALVPLLAFYALARQRKPGRWLVALLIPVLFAVVYEWITRRLYGQGMLLAAGTFAAEDRSGAQGGLLEKALIGLGFLGGCFLPVLFYLPWIWSRRLVILGLVVLAPCVAALFWQPHFKPLLVQDGHLNTATFLETAVFLAGGILVLLLAGEDFRHHRDADSLLLVLWVLGLVTFAVVLNWTINGRSLLPALPAVGILLARRLDTRDSKSPPARRVWLLGPAFLAAASSLVLTRADARLAETNRRAAEQLWIQYHQPGNTVWFEGHCAFQYYLEKAGGKAIDLNDPKKASGDILIIPANASNLYEPPMDRVQLVATVNYLPDACCATMNNLAGAGFYASVHGPLPFVIGRIEPDRFYIFRYK